MSLFDWLLVGHLIGDFLIQTDGMARHKEQQWSWMLRHVGFYMVVMTLVLVGYALTHPLPPELVAAALLFVLVTHAILDRRVFTWWWMRLVGISPEHPWLPVVVDQVFHLITLAIVAQVLAGAGD